MRPENNKNTKNIHVFRVNRSVKTREKQQSNTNTSPTTINSRTSLSAETKRLICEDHISNPKYTQEALAKKYGCKRTTVAKIIKSKERWIAIASDAAIAKRFRQRSSRYPLVENALVLWLEKEQNNLAGITDQMLRFQARQYAQNFSLEGSSGSEDFKASSSWVANFKQRYLTPKLEKLENRSPAFEQKSINDAVPESIEIKDQGRSVYRNAVHDFTSVFSVGPPKTHVHTPSPDPTSIASAANSNNTYKNEEKRGPRNKDLVVKSNTSSTENDQISVSSNAEPEEDGQEKRVKTTKKEQEEDEEMPDQDMMDYTDDFDGPYFHNDTVTTDVHTQQLSSNNETDSTTATTPPPPQQQQNNSKLSAKEHLEAALAFYTNQNESSTSMSANMIKLILQNDFVN